MANPFIEVFIRECFAILINHLFVKIEIGKNSVHTKNQPVLGSFVRHNHLNSRNTFAQN